MRRDVEIVALRESVAHYEAQLEAGGREQERLREENEKLREAAHHLRGCRECGEMDVYDCFEGKRLWEAANLEEPALSGGDRGG